MTPCLRCSREVLQASLENGARINLEADASSDGLYAIWTHRTGAHWSLKARHHAAGDRLDQQHLHRAHSCERPGEQLELGAA